MHVLYQQLHAFTDFLNIETIWLLFHFHLPNFVQNLSYSPLQLEICKNRNPAQHRAAQPRRHTTESPIHTFQLGTHMHLFHWYLTSIQIKDNSGDFPGGPVIKNPLPSSSTNTGLILGRGTRGREWQPAHSLAAQNMDRGAWWATVHGLNKVWHNWATEHEWIDGKLRFPHAMRQLSLPATTTEPSHHN